MKKTILSATAAFSVALGALAQGDFILDDSVIPNGLAIDITGNWYNGAFGMEVWVLNGTSIPAGINLGALPGSGVLGYSAMEAAGFLKEAAFANRLAAGGGIFQLGHVVMRDVYHAANVVVALAAWNTSAPSWSAMLADANAGTRAGIVAFVQPVGDLAVPNEAPPWLAMNQDLVMTPIPEPSVLALAALGGVLLRVLKKGSKTSK